jgi:cell division protein FtsQ
VVVLALLLVGAVFSPLLALKTITVTGASRVDAQEVTAALDDQLGTPLALLDFAEIRHELSKFPLIRSYVTESVPPGTLLIRLEERAPIGSVATAGGFSVVDAAGVVIESAPERAPGLPVIEAGADVDTPAFGSAVEVLLSLPVDLLAKVDRISAQSKDNVTLTLVGVGQLVDWGSPEQSALKARVLATLIASQDANAVVRYDVSSPNTPVVGAP